MDLSATWEQIWATISPYLNVTTISTAVAFVIATALKIKNSTAMLGAQLTNALGDWQKTMKAAMPKELTVSVEKIAGKEFAAMVADLKAQVLEPLQKAYDEVNAKVVAMAKCVACLKTVPQETRDELLELLGEDAPKEQEAIVLELNPELEEITKEGEKRTETAQKVYVE